MNTLSRRDFLKILALGSGALFLTHCSPTGDPTDMPSFPQKISPSGWRILGPGSGGAQYIPTIRPDDPNTALVACDMTGSYLTRDGGQTWRQLNFKVWAGAFAFDPGQPATVYAGASGLYRSHDSGETWELVFPNPTSVTGETHLGDHASHAYVSTDNFPGGKVVSICVNPQNSKNILVCIQKDGLRLFQTLDDSQTWSELLLLDGNQLLKASWILDEVFFLTDKVFSRFSPAHLSLLPLPVPGNHAFADFSGGAADGETVLYLTSPARWDNGNFISGVFRSTDKGSSWQPCSVGLDSGLSSGAKRNFNRIATCSSHPNIVYLSATEVDENWNPVDTFGIFKSTDRGETWQWALKITDKQPANRKLGWIEQDFDTAWGGAPFYMSVAPSDPQVCYATDWGGTHRTVDGGATWQQLYCEIAPDGSASTRGLDVTNTYWVCFDPHQPAHLALACTDIGLFHSLNSGQTWQHALDGVPGGVSNTCYQLVFDPDVPGKAWAVWSDCHDMPRPKMFKSGKFSRYKGALTVSTDGLASWQAAAKGLPATGVPTDLVLDPRSPAGKRTLYAAFVAQGVYKSTDDGQTWAAKNEGISGNQNAWRLVQLPDGILYLLVCRGLEGETVIDGALYISSDGAEHWRQVTLPAGVNFPNDLAFDPYHPQRLYLATWPTQVDNTEIHGGLYRSDDGGQTWTNIYDESSHVYGVTVDKNNPATVIITTFEGKVLRSDDFGQTWKPLAGFTFQWPKQPIFDPHNPGMLYVTTFGSSMWYGSAR